MKHFLVTRFNLRFKDWKTARDNSPVLTEEWLKNRFEVFQTYCFPSVVNQKNQDFIWVLFFDTETPVSYKNTVEGLAGEYPKMKIRYIDSIQSFNNSFKEFILEYIEPGDDFIITSRLDNDDAIHRDFIDTIQKSAVPEHETVIDLRRGIQLNIIDNYHEFRGNYIYPFNPFISLVENAGDFNTVFAREHPSWKECDSIIVYEKTPLWIEVVHKKNKYNYVKPDLPLIRNVNLNEFGVSKKLSERNLTYIISNNILRKIKRTGWKMYMRMKKSVSTAWKLALVFMFICIVYLFINFTGPGTIILNEDQAFGIPCRRAKDLIVQEYDDSGNLWASRGMIIYRLNKEDNEFVRVAHVPTGFSIFWLRNFSVMRKFTVRPECIEFVQGNKGELCALSAGKMWYKGPEDRGFKKTLELDHYGFGDQGMRNDGILRVNDSTIIFGEYFGNLERTSVNIYESNNNGKSWKTVYTFKPGQIRHIHAIQKDPYTGKIWVCTGDWDSECMVAWTEDNFQTLVALGSGSQMWRVCQLVFTEDAVFWGTDTGHPDLAGFYRWNKHTDEITKLQNVDGAVFYGTRISNDVIVMSTDREGWECELDHHTRLWVIHNNKFLKSIDAGTWDHNKPGFRYKFALLRFQRNQDHNALAISVLNQKEISDGDLVIISEKELMSIVQEHYSMADIH